ncbi:hypothetical protein [Microbulbifer sp. TYP-18]|uniref:hypothetical protein n=1 Tax=Microbulbifer sp. TYP-18 TaxID=3230024 RepID=UPI0034C6BC12
MKIFFAWLLSLFLIPLLQAQEQTEGSGHIEILGGPGRTEKTIDLYYHIPTSWEKDSPVVLVLPGAGRNAWSYRDAWIKKSEEKGFIVISPSYSEEHYPRFWNYNLGRMLSNVKINAEKTDFESFSITKDPNEWIFSDFDRLFNLIKNKFELTTDKYDLFGHSAGGQILHRFTLFHQSSKVNRILSANSGWYTVPDPDTQFPTGIAGAPVTLDQVKKAFSENLVIFLGELDNENETRGHLVKNKRMNKQGLHRLERGAYFYDMAKKQAAQMNADFQWKKIIVPGVGHDYKKMSLAAADYLYP